MPQKCYIREAAQKPIARPLHAIKIALVRFIRPKIIRTLKVQRMMSGTLAVVNDIKNAPNKIIIPCYTVEEGEEIIEEIKKAK